MEPWDESKPGGEGNSPLATVAASIAFSHIPDAGEREGRWRGQGRGEG